MAQKTVLVMEDEADIRVLIKRSLDMKKIRVIEANSGAKALKIIETAMPDLALLDIMMPDVDGFEVCKRLKEKPEGQKVPVVFLTVRNNPEDLARAKEAGAELYLTKPFDPYELGRKLEKLMA